MDKPQAPTPSQDRGTDSFATYTGERASASIAIDIPEIALPKGGGALKAIDEKFQVNPANGAASLSIPLPISNGRNGFSPTLGLSYNSGSGNGPFGLGWSLNQARIQRKTDKGLPRYRGGADEDTFTLSGGEDLVPTMDEAHGWQPRESSHGHLTIKQYRPRIEGDFSRIERITASNGQAWWKVTTRQNVTTLYGFSAASRLADPEDQARVFQWLPEFRYDDKGNWMRFEYQAEDLENVPHEVYERNRFNGNAPFANLYLKRVAYGNRQAWYADDAYLPNLPASEAPYFFELVFDYGEHDALAPAPEAAPGTSWPTREDPFSSYRSGFEIRTWRLCRRVLMFHRFEELGDSPCLVRSLDVTYAPSAMNDSGRAEINYLAALTQKGYIRLPDHRYSVKAMPPMTFDYQQLRWNTGIHTAGEDAIANAPSGLSAGYRWVDLHGEGLPGILSEQGNGWYYKPNLGDLDGSQTARFGPAQAIAEKPSFNGLNSGVVAIQDLEAEGRKQLVVNQTGLRGYFEISDGATPFQAFETMPRVAVDDRNSRQIDLTGDGKADLIVTEEQVFLWYPSTGKKGYGPAEQRLKAFDEEQGPTAVFSDREQSIFLADMSGDGLTDIVRVRNGEVCYWANMGYGRFSAKIAMGGAPLFAPAGQFDPRLIQLADISGTGAADLVYLGQDLFSAFINLGGNSWSEAQEIAPFPASNTQTEVAVIDLLGTGTSCIVWSSPLPADRQTPMRYIDLMDSRKPHLLTSYANNLGKEIRFEYRSSTAFYLEDKAAGNPWITKLPFPVQVLSRIMTEDHIAKTRFIAQYRYHHGYYDYAEREFRGFGMVEQQDSEHYTEWRATAGGTHLATSEDLYQSPMLTKTWYHTGAFLDREHLLSQYREDYWPAVYRRTFPEDLLAANEPELKDAVLVAAPTIGDPGIIDRLDACQWREALRACKGMALRQEVFALDGGAADPTSAAFKKQFKPYSVATHNCIIQLLQPKAGNDHAVFLVTEREALSFQYERDESDPRITHTLNTRLDDLGQPLESASIVYPRVQVSPELPLEIQQKQATTHITYGQETYSNDVRRPDAYRLRQPVETRSFEITGLVPSGNLFQVRDFEDILDTGSGLIGYEQTPTPGTVQRRPIEHHRTLYRADDLTGSLPLGVLEAKGLTYERYQLAYTPAMLSTLFQPGQLPADPGALEALLGSNGGVSSQARLVHQGDSNWWVRSGTAQIIDTGAGESVIDAQSRFYSPIAYTDAFGATTTVTHYRDYFLFTEQIEDAIGNRISVEAFNFRILSPARMRGINDNLSEVLVDELGLVKAIAVMGKGDEADDLTGLSDITSPAEQEQIHHYFTLQDTAELRDAARALLGRATTRFIYDYGRFWQSQNTLAQQLEAQPGADPCGLEKLVPVVTGIIGRERHHAEDPNSPLQLSFEYADGGGNIAMAKQQSHPGEAFRLDYQPDCSYTTALVDTRLDGQLRWVGNGRTVRNNKGNPVKQYEPYFSVTPFFEDARELVETGVTPIMTYDAPGRAIQTLYPDGSLTRATFTSWQQTTYDRNDTILDSPWYADRGSPDPAQPAPADRDTLAAWKAAQHADTPLAVHLDSLGRAVFIRAHNRTGGVDNFQETTIHLDIEGNARAVTDARGNTVMAWSYNLLGQRIVEHSMDKGSRWSLNNAAGNPMRHWDSRGHVFTTSYDALQRPLEKHVQGGDGDVPLDAIYERTVYGEGQPNAATNNLRGQIFQQYDPSGQSTSMRLDFKGNILEAQRRLTIDYKAAPDWGVAGPDSLLEAEVFTTEFSYDAMSRITATTHPDGSIVTPAYNASSLLDSLQASMSDPGGGPRTVTSFIQNITYNEKGKRASIRYGNGVRTTYTYDPFTFQLVQLQSSRQNGDPLQDLLYTYDAAGNVTRIEDGTSPTVFFASHRVEARADYTYDALYRLVEASGREHIAQVDFGGEDQWHDLAFWDQYNANDPMAWRTYTQTYRYDTVGNLSQIGHHAGTGSWTRGYAYEANTNRLASTTIGARTYHYNHHPAHGYMTTMPHLTVMQWDFRDQLQVVSRQTVANGTPEMTYYVYDANGQRVRKITENQAAEGAGPTRKDERLYLGGIEIYRKHSGRDRGLERTTLHLLDDRRRIAMVDTRNEVADGTDRRTIRYQVENHLGSVALETDQAAQIISYEEYHPFGTAAYRAVNASIAASAKRYRYTGMERDEESGFCDHGARYYLPWLGRWLSADPIGIEAGVNLYAYAENNPILYNDPNGTEARLTVDQATRTITYSTTVHVFGTAAEIATLTPIARKAEAFYRNPTIETQEATAQRLAGKPTIPAGNNQFKDTAGHTWTVNFDVTYQFHDTAVITPPFTYDSVKATPQVFAANKAAGEAQLARDVGFQAGDNILTPGSNGTAGGVVAHLTAPSPSFPTFGIPHSRMVGKIATKRGYILESLIHETGHFLGWDHRYGPLQILDNDPSKGFEFDMMAGAVGSSRKAITMHPDHIRTSAEFAIAVADGRNLVDQPLRGIQVDNVSGGKIEQFTGNSHGAATTAAYTARQKLLAKELIPFFRKSVTGVRPVAPAPAPAPVPAPAPPSKRKRK